MSEVLHINDADFETTVVQSDIPVLPKNQLAAFINQHL